MLLKFLARKHLNPRPARFFLPLKLNALERNFTPPTDTSTTDFFKFSGAIRSGAVYYDQGIKIEHAGTAKPKIKKRSQFIVNFLKMGSLYDG